MTGARVKSIDVLIARALALALVLAATNIGCTSHILKAENSIELLKNDEADRSIDVKELPTEEQPSPTSSGTYVRFPGPPPVKTTLSPLAGVQNAANETSVHSTTSQGTPNKSGSDERVAHLSGALRRNANKPLVGKKSKKPSPPDPDLVVVSPNRLQTLQTLQTSGREPAMEDSEGFIGRRAKEDPFRIGEKVVMEASYFSVVAGDLTFEVRPFVQVNGKKSYHFVGTARSTSVFAMFYAVEDWVETFVDYETLIPYNYALHVKETKQLRESRCVFDWSKSKASFWDKKINVEKKVDDTKKEWEIPPYSQNVFSAPFYLRNFAMKVGKKLAFRVAHENDNLILTAEVLRKEHISTPAGEFDTVVVKPTIQLNGVFKPVGDIFLWFTDDERKLIVRMESKIKIGKIVAIAKKIELGQP